MRNDPQQGYSLNRDEGTQIIQAPRFRHSHGQGGQNDGESIVGSLDMARAGSGNVQVNIQGRRLSASCAEIKDR